MEPSAMSRSRYRPPATATTTTTNDPEAVLQGVAMAGFVALLRQLGDLAQLAAEVFHGLHDQATAASARATALLLRARRLEAELPLVEKHLSRPPQLQHVASNTPACTYSDRDAVTCLVSCTGRVHVIVRANQNHRGVVAGGIRTPRLIAECIQRCRGPPQLSILDKYDVDGEGACLKRYTDPSFFRTHSACASTLFLKEITPSFQTSHNSKPPPDHRLESDASDDKASDGLLSMLRQLKSRHSNRSALRSIKPQLHNFHHVDPSQEKASSGTHQCEVNMLCSTNSPEISSIQDTGAVVNEEKTCGLDRTNSFQAWLSPPDAAPTPQREITEETSQDNTTSSGSVSHVASNGADLVGANKGKENSNATRNGRNLVEIITSRVNKLPRKLSVKKHDPLTESFRNMAKKLLQRRYDAIRDNGSYDFEPDSNDHDAYDKEATENSANKVPSEDVPDLDEVVFDIKSTKYTRQQVILEQSDQPCELACPPASIYEEASGSLTNCNPKETNLAMLDTNAVFSCDASLPDSEQCHLHGLQQPIIHEEQNDTKYVVMPSLPPIPRKKWLSVKLHTGSGIACPELRALEPKSPAICHAGKNNSLHAAREQKAEKIQASSQHSSWTSQTEVARALVPNENAGTDISHADGVCRDSFLGKRPEEISYQESFREDPAPNSEGKKCVFFSAVEQLRKTPPPSLPRPKYSLLELRTGSSLIYPSRALSGERHILLEQIKDRSVSLKPVTGGSPNAMVDPRNSKAHVEDDNINSDDTWSDSD